MTYKQVQRNQKIQVSLSPPGVAAACYFVCLQSPEERYQPRKPSNELGRSPFSFPHRVNYFIPALHLHLPGAGQEKKQQGASKASALKKLCTPNNKTINFQTSHILKRETHWPHQSGRGMCRVMLCYLAARHRLAAADNVP